VLRFWNNEVLSNIEGVLEMIQTAVAANSPLSDDGECAVASLHFDGAASSLPSPLWGGVGGGGR